jgi:hypothetical protein
VVQKGNEVADSGTTLRKQGTTGDQTSPVPVGTKADHDAFEKFVQQMTTPGGDCNALYRSHKTATQVTALEFDSCYYNHTLPDGHSRTLDTPVMQPGPGPNGVPTPKLEKITTQGVTADSRRLDVFVHALPSVPSVYWDQGGIRHSGSAAIVSEDGLMVSNKHVVDGSNGTLQVNLMKPDGTQELRTARVVRTEASQDLALLQLDRKPGETFPALPLSQVETWRGGEPLVEMGNANGQGTISMAKASFGSLINQNNIPFTQQPANVFQGRTMYELNSLVPHGYSGGVVLSVPGSDQDGYGNVTRQGTSAIRAITDYSDTSHKAWVIPAARAQSLINDYRREQAGTKP